MLKPLGKASAMEGLMNKSSRLGEATVVPGTQGGILVTWSQWVDFSWRDYLLNTPSVPAQSLDCLSFVACWAEFPVSNLASLASSYTYQYNSLIQPRLCFNLRSKILNLKILNLNTLPRPKHPESIEISLPSFSEALLKTGWAPSKLPLLMSSIVIFTWITSVRHISTTAESLMGSDKQPQRTMVGFDHWKMVSSPLRLSVGVTPRLQEQTKIF